MGRGEMMVSTLHCVDALSVVNPLPSVLGLIEAQRDLFYERLVSGIEEVQQDVIVPTRTCC